MLQDTAVPVANKNIIPAAEPASENIDELSTTPSAEEEEDILSSLLLGSVPSPETELNLDMTLSPAVEAPLPLRNSSENAMQQESNCQCPPGPKGDSAPEFLNNIFSFDESRGILKIDATTIELSGNLVINGFTGVKQSLFIGGDPSSGSPSTEIAAGKLLIYGPENQGPTITAFSTGPSGFIMSKLTVQGELWEDPKGLGQAKRVSTGLF